MCGFLTMGSTEVEIDVFDEALGKIEGRGPDMIETSRLFDKTFGFNRLAIMDLSENGMQPFSDDHTIVVCNGEIYNYPELKKNIMDEYTFNSSSDCEVLIPLYRKYGLDTLVRYLDGEYAFCLYDADADKMMAARDPIGIRPMFYGYTEKGTIAFGSEAKALMPVCKEIMPFPPGHYYDGEKFVCFNDVADVKLMHNDDVETIALNLRVKLIESVKKRLQSDAPVGYLLSGGLDSSLVCAIGQRITDTPIKTFAIGMETDPIDLKYAKEVADFLGTDHTEVIMTKEDVLNAKKEHPNALVAVHPECKPEVLGEADYIGSTSGIIDYIVGNDAKEFIVGTVDGVYATILKQVPDKKLYNVVRTQVCPNMKLNSLEKIIHVLETGENEVFLDEEFMNKAKAPLERMLDLAK